MAFDESISGYSLLDCTLRVLEFSLGTLTWLIGLVDYLDWRFWHSDFLCASSIYLFEIFDMLIILIDHFILLSALILILPWLFWSLHMHTLTTVYHSVWHVDSLTCISSRSSLSMMFISLFILIVTTCMYTWVIYPVLCLTACRMTVFLLLDCMLLVHVGRIYIPLPPTLLVSVIPFIPVLTIASVRPFVCLLSDRARD